MSKTKFKNEIPSELFRQFITIDNRGMYIVVKVKPNSAKQILFISDANELILAVQSPAVYDQANERVIEIMAEIFEVSKSQIKIISGQRARIKRILIANPR